MAFSNFHAQASHTEDEIDSLPSTEISDETSSNETSDAQEEWETSLQQLEIVLSMVIVPYVGKYFGRKFAYWSWSKYMRWMYPFEISSTNEAAVKSTGDVRAAATI